MITASNVVSADMAAILPRPRRLLQPSIYFCMPALDLELGAGLNLVDKGVVHLRAHH
jgi:hypothetical protein